MNAVDQEFILILVLWGIGLVLFVGAVWAAIRGAVRRKRSRDERDNTDCKE